MPAAPSVERDKQEQQGVGWRAERLTEAFGVRLQGVSIRCGLSKTQVRAIYDAVITHGVVVIPGQDLSDDDYLAFASALGEATSAAGALVESHKVYRIRNTGDDGAFMPADSPMARAMIADRMWHIDSTYMRPRATLSMLYGVVVPPTGGETEFCDARRAWDALSTVEQQRLEGLTATHSVIHSRALAGFTDELPEVYRGALDRVRRPLVQAHEETGRKALLVASHIEMLGGFTKDETVALVARLIQAATASDNCYSHRWQVGDFVLYDNRAVMHRARPFESQTHARELRTSRLFDRADVGELEAAVG